MEHHTPENRSIVSYVSRSESAVEAVALVALLTAICGCLTRAALFFL